MHPDSKEAINCYGVSYDEENCTSYNRQQTLIREQQIQPHSETNASDCNYVLLRPSNLSSDELQPLLVSGLCTSSEQIQRGSYCLPNCSPNRGEMSKIVVDPKRGKNEIDGSQAWLTLILIFLINASTLASLKVYGIIFERIVAQKYYTREEASWPISTASTIQNLAGLLTPILALSMSWRKIEYIETILFVGANVGAYFSNNLISDIMYIGVIQGIAFSIRYNMNVITNNEYFEKYRATAMGISLAGSSCGVFFLKPLITFVLDKSQKDFRTAYLALALIMSTNFIFGFFLRKPCNSDDNSPTKIKQSESRISRDSNRINAQINSNATEEDEIYQVDDNLSLKRSLLILLENPSIHCIWIMQTIYFYISRTYTIFIVDYGIDKGFKLEDSRNLLNFWVYGEVLGRLLLGGFVDSKLLNLKWNIILVNLILAISGYVLLSTPATTLDRYNYSAPLNVSVTTSNATTQILKAQPSDAYFWFFGMSIAMVAAFSSLMNIMIVPFGQEYMGKKNVPWAFAMSSIVTSIFLLLRPLLIGLSRDYLKSYNLLIIVMSSGPGMYALLFLCVEPYLRSRRYRRVSVVEVIS